MLCFPCSAQSCRLIAWLPAAPHPFRLPCLLQRKAKSAPAAAPKKAPAAKKPAAKKAAPPPEEPEGEPAASRGWEMGGGRGGGGDELAQIMPERRQGAEWLLPVLPVLPATRHACFCCRERGGGRG